MFQNVILLICLFLGTPSAEEQKAKENQYVKVDVDLSDSSVHRGGQARILISLTPIDGIHINIDPAVEVSLKKKTVFKIQGMPEMSADKESGFLSSSHPVEQLFSVSSSAKPGTYNLGGTIVYYFCSDEEGWCRKFTQPFMLTLHVMGKQ